MGHKIKTTLLIGPLIWNLHELFKSIQLPLVVYFVKLFKITNSELFINSSFGNEMIPTIFIVVLEIKTFI